MKVLVTGCAGFIGSHIAEALLEQGHEVVGFDCVVHHDYDCATGRKENLDILTDHPKFTYRDGLLQYSTQFDEEDIKLLGITHICHQAAMGSVPRSLEQPSYVVENNIMAFQTVLEAARLAGVKRVVYASSSSVYQNTSPYSMTKRVNELQAEQYKKNYGIETIGLRYFNVFGSRQRPDGAYAAVIAKWVDAIREGKTVYVNGDGRQSRDFTYIKNVVEANTLALTTQNTLAYGKAFDIGCGRSATLNFLSCQLAETLGMELIRQYAQPRAGDVDYSQADTEVAKKILGYSPHYGLEEGLEDWLLKTKT